MLPFQISSFHLVMAFNFPPCPLLFHCAQGKCARQRERAGKSPTPAGMVRPLSSPPLPSGILAMQAHARTHTHLCMHLVCFSSHWTRDSNYVGPSPLRVFLGCAGPFLSSAEHRGGSGGWACCRRASGRSQAQARARVQVCVCIAFSLLG